MSLQLYETTEEYLNKGHSCVMLTIVSAKGSTPRKTGAKMIILPNGKTIGTIGGGCVESNVRQKALEVLLQTHKNEVVTCHLNGKLGTTDADICGGSITVLIEYITAP